MKSLAIILLSVTLAGTGAVAFADEALQSSRSAGKLQQDQSVDLSAELRQLDPLIKSRPSVAEDYASSARAQEFDGIANRHDQLFEIYDADVRLISDLDGDGYHHAINVVFDVDVSYDSATVYAKLYLSREGEPWSQYFTTDLFRIHGDEYADTYEVETELLDGYLPGHYAVLVEIYSLDHAYMVASEVLDYYYLGRELTLEGLYWDEPRFDAHGEVGVYVGAGSFASLLIFFLIIQVVIAARGTLAQTPVKKAINNNKKRFP